MKKYNKKGFTLIELLISLTILILLTPIIYVTLTEFSQKVYLNDIKIKSLTNMTVVNNLISGIVTNSYWIKYSELDLWSDLDKIVLYTDKLEENTISIYVKQELDKDISRVYISKWGREYSIHTTDLFVEKFNIAVSPNPSWINIDIQPWVQLTITWRTRSPLEEPTDDQYYDLYNKSEGNLYWRWLIRNYVPSSWKY